MPFQVFVHYNAQVKVVPRDKRDLIIGVIHQQNRDVLFEITVKDLLTSLELSRLFQNRSFNTMTVNPTFFVYDMTLRDIFLAIGHDNISNKEIFEPVGVVGLSILPPLVGDTTLNGCDILVVPESVDATRIYAKLSHKLSRIVALERDQDVEWQLTTMPFEVMIARPFVDVVETIEFLTGVEPVTI